MFSNRFNSHISSALKILENFNGSQPLAQHVKHFFSKEKKYGSKDRKHIAALCYGYFRTGLAMKNKNKAEKILAGAFLSENGPNESLVFPEPGWNEKISFSSLEKLSFLGVTVDEMFPYSEDLSEEIDRGSYIMSFLKQPRFFYVQGLATMLSYCSIYMMQDYFLKRMEKIAFHFLMP